ncbi:MAG: helix-turn-helix domain-containing protein [Gaiellaceae bacterium]
MADRAHQKRSNHRFVDELPELLSEKGLSVREIARRAKVDPGHLSRVLRQVAYKTPSGELTRKIAVALGRPPDYWPEYREAIVLEHVRADPAFRDRVYVSLKRRQR